MAKVRENVFLGEAGGKLAEKVAVAMTIKYNKRISPGEATKMLYDEFLEREASK